MERDEILYSSVDEQIRRLQTSNLIINDCEFARDILDSFGYSNVIKSYRTPYVIEKEGHKRYRSDVKFEQIYSLYLLDTNLRNDVMAAMQDLEEFIKEQAASVIAKSFGTHQDDYLKKTNYRNKKKRVPRYSLENILKTMRRTLETDLDPIHHYITVHQIVPPWILFKSIYFSTMINFIDQFKIPEQNELVDRIFVDNLNLDYSHKRMLLKDILSISLEYRNKAAHGGRIYNFMPRASLREKDIFGISNENRGFSQLVALLGLFKYNDPYERLNNVINREVNRHCSYFPQDVTYLGQVLNIDIIPQDIVYVTEKSKKYHQNPTCSGMVKSQKMEREEAINNNYQACKRCCKN